jgi:transposase
MNDSKALTARQTRVIPYLLDASSIDKGCKRAGVSRVTVWQWLKQENFREELKRQRDELVRAALDSLKANVGRATETLVNLLSSKSEPLRARAAEDILNFTLRALEHEELEKRIEALEERLLQQGGSHR